MKKQVITAFIALIPAVSFAKISDFNAMIAENTKAQSELHTNVQNNLAEARQASAEDRRRVVVVESSSDSYIAPTKKGALAYKKERANHQASEKKQFDRLANELSLSGE